VPVSIITDKPASAPPESGLALRLALGALVLVAAGWAFGEIAEDVASGELVKAIDEPVTAWLRTHAWEPLTRALLVFTHAHGVAAISVYTAILAAWLARRRERYWLLTLALAVPGGMVVNALMKLAFARARPVVEDPLLTLATYSFPSGHAAGATLFYGFLAVYALSKPHGWGSRVAIPTLACVLIALVAFSRVYLGVHYVTDVAAAVAEGVAWLAICVSGVHALRIHKGRRKGP
jgi:membrane-associated phospholipid phosphatase